MEPEWTPGTLLLFWGGTVEEKRAEEQEKGEAEREENDRKSRHIHQNNMTYCIILQHANLRLYTLRQKGAI